MFEIAWGGDVLLGDAAADSLEANGHGWVFERIEGLLEANYLIANVEGPITSIDAPYFPDQKFSYNADPAAAGALGKLGLDAAGLSNNHALDRGPEGLKDTIDHLLAAGVTPFGAGARDEAEAPHLVETPFGIVAIIALSEAWRYGAEASGTEIGTLPITAQTVARGHELGEAAGARWIVAFVHWGENYAEVTPEQRAAAQLFADAGYDLVIGHHPHVTQEVGVIGDMPVLYSLGNLAFGTPGRFAPGDGYGVIATTRFGPSGAIKISLSCIVTDNDVVAYQPERCSTAEALRLYERLGDTVRADGAEGLIEVGG